MKPRSRSRLPLQYYACVLWTGKFRRPGRGVVCEYRKQPGPLRAHLTTGDDHASCPYGAVPPMRHARVSHPVNGNQEEHPLSTIDRQEPRLGIPDTTETQTTTTPAFTRAIPSPCINPLTTTGTNSNHDHSDDTTPSSSTSIFRNGDQELDSLSMYSFRPDDEAGSGKHRQVDNRIDQHA